jgi:tetratricopeptide (TPR) repeat protein
LQQGAQQNTHVALMASPPERTETAKRLTEAWKNLDEDVPAAQREAEALLSHAPNDAEAALLLAAAWRRLGKPQDAAGKLRKFMTGSTQSPLAWFEWGMILAELGEESSAVEALHRAVSLAPGFTAAWRGLADLHVALGEAQQAGIAYAAGLRAEAAGSELAAAAASLAEDPKRAEALLRARLRSHPGDMRARHLLAEAAMRLGAAADAEAILQTCPDGFAQARHSLAILYYLQRRYADAASHLNRLLAILPHQPALRLLHLVCLREMGDFHAALPAYQDLLARAPKRHAIWLGYGHVLKALGRDEEAVRAYRTCLDLNPGWAPSVYLSLADLKIAKLNESDLAGMRRALAGSSVFGQAQLHYAMGHVLEQDGDYEGAFADYARGAALRRQEISYDADETTSVVTATKLSLDRAFFAAHSGSGNPSEAPIFIIGLPRSGTTLVEQILASHPDVEGTFELQEIGLIADAVRRGRPMADYPAALAALNQPALAELGAAYLDKTRQFRRLGRPRFTDKMPGNLLHIGLIHLILPNAPIIDVRRAPMAAGFAAFRQFFQAAQNFADFSYDLREIGRYYRDYLDLMAHFDAVLPGRIFHMSHEALVHDPEGSTRSLLDYCGLCFEPACLRFWQTDRPVLTPSAQQVRRPLDMAPLEHWRNFAPWLVPLREALQAAPF